MLLECLIEREGYSIVTVQKNLYEFKRNKEGRQVCEINSGSHLEYLLKLPDFRKYEAPEIPEEPTVHACDRCNTVFANAAGLSAHKRSKGYQDEPIADPLSNKGNLG